ncbi:MAG: DUF5916 domain-containing protein [Saprospiraceae bacterium]|nr:DUF5916 domain-containing protein [Saprospiraceae bacterium]
MNRCFILSALAGILTFGPPQGGWAQAPAPVTRALTIRNAAASVKIDGVLDEAAWQAADKAEQFTYNFPVDTGFSQWDTEVRLTFDDRFLYVGAVCKQNRADYTIQSRKRDFAAGTSDAFNVLFDPFNDGLNGFFFSVNPLNVQREALIDNGQTLSFEWDNKWYSAVQNHEAYWVIEMAIPFKTLRYTPDGGVWRVNFARTKLKDWEVSTWYPVPQQFSPNNIAFSGEMIWETPPPKPGANVAVIPYVTGSYGVDVKRDPETLEQTHTTTTWDGNAGVDAKIGLSPSLNLDLTVNPDFSQVEVDRQLINLSRFELFFPERRQFFLENRDLFALFGFPSARPFFSRRIGIARNPITGAGQTVPILAGARLSGKLNDNWRVGLLNMQTQKVEWDADHALPAANYTVATVQRKTFERSALGAILVNKQQFLEPLNENQRIGNEPWNRVAGLEYNLYSKDNRWEGEWYYHRSFSPDEKKNGSSLANFLRYEDRHVSVAGGWLRVDSFYTAEVGFVPRKGINNVFLNGEYTFYPQRKHLNTWGAGADWTGFFDLGMTESDRNVSVYSFFNFKDQSAFNAGAFHSYIFLFEPFDPSNGGDPDAQPLPGMQGYAWNGGFVGYNSSTAYDLQGRLSVDFGGFFNGTLFNVQGNMSYRVQPLGSFGLGYTYNRLRLPEPYASTNFWLVGPSAELAFTRSVFLSAFFQYNTQANNFNINTRLQWRYLPVSDLFLVYTDNSYAQPVNGTDVRFLTPKNRTLVLKLVYWLNV